MCTISVCLLFIEFACVVICLYNKCILLLAWFVQEKQSFLNYNVSCILTMPPYMRKGFGKMLIDFSKLCYFIRLHVKLWKLLELFKQVLSTFLINITLVQQCYNIFIYFIFKFWTVTCSFTAMNGILCSLTMALSATCYLNFVHYVVDIFYTWNLYRTISDSSWLNQKHMSLHCFVLAKVTFLQISHTRADTQKIWWVFG